MKNKFLTRGVFASAVLTGWLIFTSLSGNAFAAEVDIAGGATKTAGQATGANDINAADGDSITTSGSGVATVDMKESITGSLGTVAVSNDTTLTIDDTAADNDFVFKSGAVTLSGTSGLTTTNNVGAATIASLATGTDSTLTSGDAGITVTGGAILEGDESLTVAGAGAVDMGTGVTLEAGNTGTTTVTVTNSGTTDLADINAGAASAVTISDGAGAVNIDSVDLDTGLFTFTHNDDDAVNLGDVTADGVGNALTIAGTGGGEVSAANLAVSEDLTVTADKAFSVSTATTIADGKTLSVAATGDVALGAVTGGNAGALTTSGTGGVSATSLQLDDGVFTATNGGSGTLSLGNVTTTDDAGELTTATGAVTADNMTINNNTTLTAGAAFTANGITAIADSKTLSVAATGDVALGAVTGGNAGALTTSGTGGVSATSLQLDDGVFTATNGGSGTLSLGNVTTTDDAGELTTATGAVTADNMTINNNTTLTAGAAFTANGITAIADSKTLSVAATGDVALGAVTGGNAGALTTSGTGGVSATSLQLDDGVFTATNGGSGTLSLGNVTTTDDAGELTTATGAVTAQNFDIDNDTTINTGAGAGLTLSGTTDIAAGKVLTINADATGAISLQGTTIHNGGSIVSTGSAASGTTLSVGANDAATIDVSNATGVLSFTSMTAGAGSNITISTSDDATEAGALLDLGDVTFNGGVTATANASGSGSTSIIVGNFTNTGAVSILKCGTASAATAYVKDNSTIQLDYDVIYDGFAMDYSGSGITVTGNGQFINAAGAASQTTAADTDMSVNSSEVIDTTNAITSGYNLTVSNGATAVASKASTTVDAGGSINIESGANYTQYKNDFAIAGDANLGGELLLTGNGSHSIASLNAVGTSGKIRGDDAVSIAAMDIESGEKIKVENTVNLSASDDLGAGTLELGNTDSTSAATLNLANNATSVGTLGVTNGEYAVLTDASGTETLTLTNGADIEGHLDITGGANLTVNSGAFKVSANTLNIGDGSTVTIGETAYIADSDTGGDSHFTVISNGAANTATVYNQSTQSANKLNLLDVQTTATGFASTLNFDNDSVNDAVVTLTTVNVDSLAIANTDNATLNLQNSGGGTHTIAITNLNINDTANSTASVVLSDIAGLDVTVDNVNFNSGDDGALTGAATSSLVVGNVTVDAVSAGAAVTGTITAGAEKTSGNITGTVTLTGDNTNVATLVLADQTNITGTVVLAGDTDGDANLNISSVASAIDNISVASGKYGNISNGGSAQYYGGNINGQLYVDSNMTIYGYDGYAYNIGSGGILKANGALTFDNTSATPIMTIGAGGNVTATSIDTTNGKVVLNLGTSAGTAGVETDTTKFATIDGGTITSAKSGTTLTELYGTNGVSGTTYADVFDDDSSWTSSDTLSTNELYRTYTVVDKDGGTDYYDVQVSTNTSGVNSAVMGNGGTADASRAANFLIDNQGRFDATGQAYVQRMSQLSAPTFAKAAEQTIGEEGTTATTQAGVMSVQNSAGAVSNQMTNFRSGNIAAAMTSSYSSGGATSALSNMADADTLADAYDAGFTSASDQGVYRKIQVWANGFGGFGEQGSEDNMIGYDFWNIGTMVGFDYAFAKELRVGALLGYSYNNTDSYQNSGDSDDNAIRFGAYASYNWDNFFVDLSPTMGIHIIDSSRNIWNGAVAKGERTGVDFNMSTTIGYTFNLPAEIQLTPSYSLSYTMFYDPDYTETGAGAANVSYDSFTSNSLVQDLGARVGKLFRVSDNLAFLPEAWGGWEVEYLNTGGTRNTTTSASIGSQAYSTTMNGMATHRGYWGAGLTALINDNVSVYGRYDQKVWDKGYNVGFSAGVKVDF